MKPKSSVVIIALVIFTITMAGKLASPSNASPQGKSGEDVKISTTYRPSEQLQFYNDLLDGFKTFSGYEGGTRKFDENKENLDTLYDKIMSNRNVVSWVCIVSSAENGWRGYGPKERQINCEDGFWSYIIYANVNAEKVYPGDTIKFSGNLYFDGARKSDLRLSVFHKNNIGDLSLMLIFIRASEVHVIAKGP